MLIYANNKHGALLNFEVSIKHNKAIPRLTISNSVLLRFVDPQTSSPAQVAPTAAGPRLSGASSFFGQPTRPTPQAAH